VPHLTESLKQQLLAEKMEEVIFKLMTIYKPENKA